MASPIELLGLGRAGWHLDFCVTLRLIWKDWKPLGYGDKVVVVQYYFPFCLHAVGTPLFIFVLVLRKVGLELLKRNNAASLFIKLFPTFPKPGLKELELTLTQGSLVL